MASVGGVGGVGYNAYGPTSAGQVPPATQPASATAPAEVSQVAAAPVAAAPVPAAAGKPGTVNDVIAANVAAKDSAEAIGAPSETYMSSMSQLVRAASNNVQKLGGRLDTEI
jgi:hypothetical protein